ncbi:MAG: hypothetical protein AUK44_00925 [Porphyromonadaceae bacterium CG2_30_38_12]|nr:MAG: hypothetical protein AUK44_00925 [Porphyromonadaceae bacterium CG2_30_38_12]
MKNLFKVFNLHWQIYLIEAWALGMFMISASAFVIFIEHPHFLFSEWVSDAFNRRLLVGVAMGTTAMLLIYSRWGKRSGAHMNPAVTLTFYMLNRICWEDTFWYIVFQFAGGYLGVLIFKVFWYDYISAPTVNYVITIPGVWGWNIAFFYEFLISFLIMFTVLMSSNSKLLAKYTGFFVGFLLILFITFEAPFSGMSMNPARTVASALAGNQWDALWIYFVAPLAAMLLAGYIYKLIYTLRNNGQCKGLKIHLSGNKNMCETYEEFDAPDETK